MYGLIALSSFRACRAKFAGGRILVMKNLSGVSAKGKTHYWRRAWMLYAMLLLPMAFFIIFRYIPMTNIVIAFKDYNIFQGVWSEGSPWVGFKWFQRTFATRDFWFALRNTVWLNLLDLIMGFPAPIILALLLNELVFKNFKKLTQTIIYLPHFLSWIIVSSIASRLLAPTSGVVNMFLVENFGIGPIDFLMDKGKWVMTYILLGIWKEMGWGTMAHNSARNKADYRSFIDNEHWSYSWN